MELSTGSFTLERTLMRVRARKVLGSRSTPVTVPTFTPATFTSDPVASEPIWPKARDQLIGTRPRMGCGMAQGVDQEGGGGGDHRGAHAGFGPLLASVHRAQLPVVSSASPPGDQAW